MHDRNGFALRKGDRVLIPATVVSDGIFANGNISVDLDYNVSDNRLTSLTLHATQMHLRQRDAIAETFSVVVGLSFSEALNAVKTGRAIQRAGWNGTGLVIKAQFPDEHSKMTLPYLYIEYPITSKTTPGARCPWHASQSDIMAEDWIILRRFYAPDEGHVYLEPPVITREIAEAVRAEAAQAPLKRD